MSSQLIIVAGKIHDDLKGAVARPLGRGGLSMVSGPMVALVLELLVT